MHKDYHQVYKLSKYFTLHNIGNEEEIEPVDIEALQKNYFQFCMLLTIFSIGHFNFTCEKEKQNTFSRLSMNFEFKQWKLKLSLKKLKEQSVLLIDLEKDSKYRIVLIPIIKKDGEECLDSLRKQIDAEDYIVCSPYENEKNCIEISMTSIESFRRIQQIILKGMIYADEKHEDCPFCNHQLSVNLERSTPNRLVYECTSCRTGIEYGYCPEQKKTYYYTQIVGLTRNKFEGDSWLVKRKLEAQMYFRNITKLNEDMEIICPYCNRVH